MKALWVATGVVVGLGVAGLIATAGGEGSPNRINVGVGDSVEDTSQPTTTGVPVPTSIIGSGSTTTTAEGAAAPAVTHGIANVPPLAATTTEMPTTTTSYWRTIGDACSTPGAIGVSGSGVTLICTGSPSSWQPA